MIADAISDAVDVGNISSLIIIRADSEGVEEQKRRVERRVTKGLADEITIILGIKLFL